MHVQELATQVAARLIASSVGEYPKAESLLLQAQGGLVAALGAASPRTQINTRRLVALYTAWKKPVQAAEWQGKLSKPVS